MVKTVALSGRMPSLDAYDVSSFTHVVTFDATLAGHRAALTWATQNPTAVAGRIVVPYCGRCGDYKRHRSGCDAEPAPRFTEYPRGWVFKLAPLEPEDVRVTIELMERDLLTREALSGRSLLQTFLATAKGDPAEVQAIACARFHVPMALVREQWESNQPHDPDIYPIALLSSFPINPDSFRELLVDYFNVGPHRRWASLPPHRKGFRFERAGEGWVSVCIRDEAGDIVGLPYGISPATFAKANPGCDKTDWSTRFSASATNLLTAPVAWDPVFRERRFEDQNDYMDWWIAQKLRLYANEVYLKKRAAEKDMKRRDFIRTIHLACTSISLDGERVPTYVGEEPHAKRMRIRDEYGDYQDFADIPVGEIGSDQGDFIDEEALPESGKDVWLAKLS